LGEMVRGRLAGGDILVAFQEIDLLGRGNMQYVDARASLSSQANQPLGAVQRGYLVAPDRVRRRVVLHALAQPRAQPELVLGMEGSTAARVSQDRGDALVVFHQQASGRGPHENLDASCTGQPFELADICGIIPRTANPQGEIAMHASCRASCAAPCRRAPTRWLSADRCWAFRIRW